MFFCVRLILRYCLFLFLFQSTLGNCAYAPNYPKLDLTDIQGMDVYDESGKVHVVLMGKPGNSNALALLYLSSKDNGKHWSKPMLIENGESETLISRRGNDPQIAAKHGKLMVAFRQSGEFPDSGVIQVSYSDNGGGHWRRGGKPAIGDVTNNQSYADLVADHLGQFHLIWLDDRDEKGNTQGLRYAHSRDNGQSWQGDITLDETVCTCCWARLLALPDNSLVSLYRDEEPRDMKMIVRAPNLPDWKTQGTVGAFDWHVAGCPHCGGSIAVGQETTQQTLHSVVWTGKDGAAGLYYLRSKDKGLNWSEPLQLALAESRESDIASRKSGQLGVVYVGDTGKGKGIWFVHSEDQGKHWSKPSLLSHENVQADHPRLLGGAKGFLALWTEKQASGGKHWVTAAITKNKN